METEKLSVYTKSVISIVIVLIIVLIMIEDPYIAFLILISGGYLYYGAIGISDNKKLVKHCHFNRYLSISLIIIAIAELSFNITKLNDSFAWALLLISAVIGALSLLSHTIITSEDLNNG